MSRHAKAITKKPNLTPVSTSDALHKLSDSVLLTETIDICRATAKQLENTALYLDECRVRFDNRGRPWRVIAGYKGFLDFLDRGCGMSIRQAYRTMERYFHPDKVEERNKQRREAISGASILAGHPMLGLRRHPSKAMPALPSSWTEEPKPDAIEKVEAPVRQIGNAEVKVHTTKVPYASIAYVKDHPAAEPKNLGPVTVTTEARPIHEMTVHVTTEKPTAPPATRAIAERKYWTAEKAAKQFVHDTKEAAEQHRSSFVDPKDYAEFDRLVAKGLAEAFNYF